MKVVVSLTSTPPRFKQLASILPHLVNQACHEVRVNIPAKYDRFPDWDGTIPAELASIPRVTIHTGCEDFGPATKSIPTALDLDPDDLIVYLDDDTLYDPKLVLNLIKWHKFDPRSAWGLSGFKFEDYFRKHYPRNHGVAVDVLEGYGGVIVKAGWIQNLVSEFREIRSDRTFLADDLVISNMLAKQGVTRRTVFTPECNICQIGQLDWGFGSDALHSVVGGGHHANYLEVLKFLEDKAKNYFTNKCW
jgi:hypothetical protein